MDRNRDFGGKFEGDNESKIIENIWNNSNAAEDFADDREDN